jgi:hypothetical protein
MFSFFRTAPGSGGNDAEAASMEDGPVWSRSREKIESYYRQGQCHFLAIAIRRSTGLPLGALWNPLEWHIEPDKNGEGGVPEIVHVYVVTPDGGVIDILGERSLDAMRISEAGDEWEACRYGALTDERLVQLIEDTGNLRPYDSADIAVAEEVIRRTPELASVVAAYALGGDTPATPRA